MVKSTMKLSLLIALLASAMFMPGILYPANALTARGVLGEGDDYVHFDLTLTANITLTAFNFTRTWFEENKEMWQQKWNSWKNRWEDQHTDWRGKWIERMRNWIGHAIQLRNTWRNEWTEEWNMTWNDEWAEKWNDWQDWMDKWETKWEDLKYNETEQIPAFLKHKFWEKMVEKFDDIWEKHIHASLLASCWTTPALHLGLKNALSHSLNRTLQWLYNTTDVYIRNYTLSLEITTKTLMTDDTYLTSGIYNLTQSFDIYGIIINNATGTFIKSQFRHFNITEEMENTTLLGFPRKFTPGKAMFLDFSVFAVPLDNWTNTFDPGSNVTTFSLVRDINVTTQYGSVIIDPEMVLVVPGKAIASGETIMVALILPTDLIPLRLIAATTVVATVLVAGYYMIKRKTIIAVPKGRTA
jgi:hypothetical protein